MTIAKTNRMQYFLLIPNMVFCKAIGITAGVMARKIGSDVWLSMAMGFVAGTAVMLLMVFLCSRFPEKTIVQITDELFGKLFGGVVAVLLALFFVMVYSASANVMTLHLSEYFLPDTPFFVLCLMYTLLCAYGAILGTEVIIRFALLSFVMSVLITVAMVTGTIPDLKIINLLPLMDKGFTADFLTGFYVFGDVAMAVMAIAFIYPMLNRKQKVLPLTLGAMAVTVLMVVIWPVFETAVMGPDMMKQYVVVCMQQIRCAQLTKYLPRYELVMVSFFTFGTFIQSALMFHFSQYCIKQLTGIRKDWVIIVPLTVVMVFSTYYMGVDHNRYIDLLAFPYTQICILVSIGLPVVLIFTALVRGRLKRKKA